MKKVRGLYARKSGIYYADINIDGRRIERSLKTRDYAEAVYKLGKLKKAQETSFDTFDPFNEPMLLSEGLERAMEERFSSYADSKTAQAHIKTIIKLLGDLPLHEISARHISYLRNTLKKQGKVEGTINRYMGHLSVILHLAMEEWEELETVPRIPRYKEKGKRYYILNPKDEKRLLEWMYEHKVQVSKKTARDGWHYAQLATVLLDTGLRLSEGLNLEARDIEGSTVVVRSKNAKSGKARSVPLSVDAMGVLQDRLGMTDGNPTDALFAGLGKWAAIDRMRKAKKGLNLEHTDLGWHSLRHTCATRLLAAGSDIVTVQTWLGHHDIKTTRRYLHYVDGAMEKALANVQAMFTRN